MDRSERRHTGTSSCPLASVSRSILSVYKWWKNNKGERAKMMIYDIHAILKWKPNPTTKTCSRPLWNKNVLLFFTCNEGSWYPCLCFKALWQSSKNKRKMSNDRKPTPAKRSTNPGVKVASIGRRVTSTSEWPAYQKELKHFDFRLSTCVCIYTNRIAGCRRAATGPKDR